MTGHELIPVIVICAVAFGMVLALLGSVKPALAKRLGMDEARVGGLLSALNLALIPMLVIGGLLVDHFGARPLLIAGSLVTGLAVFALAVSRTYRACLYAVLLTAAGAACLNAGAVRLMPVAFFDGSPAASLNLGMIFFGLGALVAPALADILVRRLDLRHTLGLVAVLCLVPAVVATITAGPAYPAHGTADLGSVLQHPTLWLTGLIFLLYVPLEGTVGTWAVSYLGGLGCRERQAGWLLSGFWLTFMAGRLLMSILQRSVLPEGWELWTILILALAAGIVLGNLAGTHSRVSAAWGLLTLGALLGPIFPTLVGFLFDQEFARDERATAYGAMFALGSAGSLFFMPLLGAFARRHSVREALRLPTFGALILAGATLVIALLLL
jgi:fucose permease